MKQSYPFAEQQKDSESLIRQILDQNTLFNLLEPNMITEILLAFKVNEANLIDRNLKTTAIKQKLLDMIIDERDECASYLILPKFNNVTENTKGVLRDIITTTWNTFLKRQIEQQKNRKCIRYFCRTENLKQAEQFHVGLFSLFKSAYFYQSPSFYRMMGGYPPMMPPPNTQTFQGYTPMPIPGLAPDPYYSMTNQMGITPTQSGNVKIEDDKNGMSDLYNLSREQAKKNKKKMINEQMKKSEKQFFAIAPINQSFINCACKGKYLENDKHFECEQCRKKFHLKCLNIPYYATEKTGVKKICPQCSLKNSNGFYLVIGEPIQTFWSDDRELHKQKIVIKGKRCKQILQSKYSIQLKFMKIEGRTMYDWQNSGITKTSQSSEKPKSTLNEVLIKDEVLTKGSGDDVKISLDCMKPSEKSEDKKPILLFVAVNVVKQKSLQEMLNSNYEYFEQNYLDKFMKGRDQLKIEIFDIRFKILNKPVRGSDCEHPDLYDLEQLASHCIDLRNDLCFCCSKRCRTFKIDRKVEQQIKKIKATYSDQSKYPQAIYYQKDGTFKWTSDNEFKMNEQRSENNNGMDYQNQNGNKQLWNQNEVANEEDQDDQQIQFSSISITPMESQEEDQQLPNNKNNKSSKTSKIKKQPKD